MKKGFLENKKGLEEVDDSSESEEEMDRDLLTEDEKIMMIFIKCARRTYSQATVLTPFVYHSYDKDEDGLLSFEEVKEMLNDIGQLADDNGYRSAHELTRDAFEHSCISMGLNIAAWPPEALAVQYSLPVNNVNKDFDKVFPPPPPPKLEITVKETSVTTVSCLWETDYAKPKVFVAETVPHIAPPPATKNGQNSPKPVLQPAVGFSEGAAEEGMAVDLRPGTEYIVRVRLYKASDANGKALQTAELHVTTDADIPDTPEELTVTSVSRTGMKVRWTKPSSNGSKIVASELQWNPTPTQPGVSSDPAQQDRFETIYEGPELTYRLTKLEAASAYTFRVRVKNGLGPSGFSPISTFWTNMGPPQAPPPPTAEVLGARSITLRYGIALPDDWEWRLEGTVEGTNFDVLYNGTNKTYCCSGLEPHSEYSFRVTAKNTEGASPPSQVTVLTTMSTVPAAPAAPELSSKCSPFGCVATWGNPKDHGSAILEYELQLEETGGALGIMTVHKNSERRAIIGVIGDDIPTQPAPPEKPRLKPTSTYRIRVRATNGNGPGEFSCWKEFTAPPARPAAPGAPHLKSRGESELELGWSPGANHGSAVTDYKLEVRLDGTGGSPGEEEWSEAYSGPNRCALLGGFKAGQSLLARLYAKNAVGWSAASPEAILTTASAVPLPPPMLEASRIARCTMRWSWGDADGRGSPVIEHMLLLRAKDDDGKSGDWWEVYKGSARECEAGGLKPGWTYEARVRASNMEGHSAWSTTVSATTKPGPPDPPHAVEARDDCGRIRVKWAAANGNGAVVTGYRLEAAIGAGGWRQVYTGNERNFVTESQAGGSKHSFRVQSINAEGVSVPSSVSSVTSAAGVPGQALGLNLVSATGTTIKIKWSKAEANGSIVLSWIVQVRKVSDGDTLVSEVTLPAASLTYKASKLDVATVYSLRLAAVNIVGRGDWSAPLQVSTTKEVPPPPKPVKKPQPLRVEEGDDSRRTEMKGTRKAKKDRDLAYSIKVKLETEQAEKERKRLQREASWKYKISQAAEWSQANPMVISSCFVVLLVLIMMFVGIDEGPPTSF